MPTAEPTGPIASLRKRPGMYIGDVHDGSGLQHLLWEVVANAGDEHLAGFCRAIAITLHDDGRITVEDDGRGIAVAPLADGTPFVEAVLTRMHDRATFDGHLEHVHVGRHGVGIVSVNALSSQLVVETARDGRLRRQEHRAGAPTTPLADLGPTERRGTRITYAPDPAIFTNLELDVTAVRARLVQLAGLCPGLAVRLADQRSLSCVCPNGLTDLLARERRGDRRLPEQPLHARGAHDGVAVEVSLHWASHRWGGRVRSFVNLEETPDGGTHVAGLQRALRALVGEVRGPEQDRMEWALTQRLVGIVAVTHFTPSFDRPTRSRLTSPEVRPVVEAVVHRCLRDFAQSRPEELGELLDSVAAEGASA